MSSATTLLLPLDNLKPYYLTHHPTLVNFPPNRAKNDNLSLAFIRPPGTTPPPPLAPLNASPNSPTATPNRSNLSRNSLSLSSNPLTNRLTSPQSLISLLLLPLSHPPHPLPRLQPLPLIQWRVHNHRRLTTPYPIRTPQYLFPRQTNIRTRPIPSPPRMIKRTLQTKMPLHCVTTPA